jgi:enamine deaminase RidA (YjgF/YER057c/UK114 family)
MPAGWVKPTSPYSYAIQSGDTLFLSGMASRNMTDLSAVRGDMATQTRKILDNTIELLKAAGMSLDDAVASRVALRNITEFPNMSTAYGPYWDVKDMRATGAVPGRPARGSIGLGLPGPHDVEITFVAVKGSSPREIIIPPNPDGSPGQLPGPSSPGVKVGNRIWLAGTTGSTPQNTGDIKAQTTEVLTRLNSSLKASGFAFKDVVATEVWLANVSQVKDMNEAYRVFFPTDPPVRKMVGAEPLGRASLITVALMAVK